LRCGVASKRKSLIWENSARYCGIYGISWRLVIASGSSRLVQRPQTVPLSGPPAVWCSEAPCSTPCQLILGGVGKCDGVSCATVCAAPKFIRTFPQHEDLRLTPSAHSQHILRLAKNGFPRHMQIWRLTTSQHPIGIVDVQLWKTTVNWKQTILRFRAPSSGDRD